MGSTATSGAPPPQVAVVGGGIVGLILAAGLHRRSIPVAVYERYSSFRESGAGIGFNSIAKECMETIDPAVLTALRLCGGVPISAADPNDPRDYLRWVDGCPITAKQGSDRHQAGNNDEGEEEELAPGGWQRLYLKADAGYKGVEGTRRDHFLEQLGTLLPTDMIYFNKQLENITDPTDGGKITLTFADGTTATADAVIGCDGIRSKTREFVLSPSSPPCEPTYAHVRSYRALLPMASAMEALDDPEEWTEVTWTSHEAPRSNVETALSSWHPRLRKLVELLPERLPVLGVFDMRDHPLARYNSGRVCVAGDAAHASSPHHGAGAGMGIEDALCLSALMAEVASTMRYGGSGVSAPAAIATAFRVYDAARRRRSQWLVNSSRRVCELQHNPDFGNPAKRMLAETCFEEILDRTLKIWNFDYMAMVRQSVEKYGRAINAMRVGQKV